MLDSVGSDKKGVVKAKQMEALKRLGHQDLQLDEYERMSGSESFSFLSRKLLRKAVN